MKKVSLKTLYRIEMGVVAVLILLVILWRLLVKLEAAPAAQVLACGIAALAVGWCVVALIFRRCPHCHSFFRRYRRFCGQCGKELDW